MLFICIIAFCPPVISWMNRCWLSGKQTQAQMLSLTSQKWGRIGSEGVQDILPQWGPWCMNILCCMAHGVLNILSWMNNTGRRVTLTFPLPSPNTDHKTLLWEVSFLYPEQRSILISKDKCTRRESEQTSFARFPQFIAVASYSLTCHISSPLCVLHQTLHKSTQA